MKKVAAAFLALVLCLALGNIAFAVQEEKATVKSSVTAPKMNIPKRPMGSMFEVINGKVTKIDNSDPANINIEVKNEADNSTKIISVVPYTNINKIADISDLKVGDDVRVMARKSDDKEIAMGVMFGNLKKLPMPGPMATRPPIPAPVKKETVPDISKK